FCIDKDGCLCIFDDNSEIIQYDYSSLFYDNNGNLYYADIGAVYWDEQGNVIFPKFVRECMYLKSK
ncbi:MAG: hypothetical protein K2K42_03395, partial [Eubacterium sp.]|nr:hypothetical protein [Eubacterium sp.]